MELLFFFLTIIFGAISALLFTTYRLKSYIKTPDPEVPATWNQTLRIVIMGGGGPNPKPPPR